jgi:hypothetical protein
MMSLLNQISQQLISQNQFSIHKAADLSNALCHAWFISQDASHSEHTQALKLIELHQSHPILEFAALCQPAINEELKGRTLPQGEHALWALFSPEAIECETQPEQVREKIQTKRTISNLEKGSQAITDVADQLLLTSNVLLGIPLEGDGVEHIKLDERFHQTLAKAQAEEQEYWYDHPIPVGISAQENEILYGIKHLDRALETEVERGNLRAGQKLTVALSCSVTHPSLAQIAKQYVEYEIRTHLNLKHIEVAVFGENECQAILAEGFPQASEALKGVFGVNGAYGRHYTFLKAVAPLWQKGIKPSLKATFKIDLDQVFEQSMLIEETGQSFFEHILHSNWGANGIDAEGNQIHLGMLGGGLVNETDAHKGLFTADVKAPNGNDYAVFEQLFCARWPQALSTQEEIISKRQDLQRVHVTGGTNGILIDSLYKFRPYTPTFIHRAEDQAFILSALANPVDAQYLVYSHQPGLIMRHDKEAFAGRVMQVAESGKVLGDIERVLLFSSYAKHHPLGLETLKEKLYPFTGTFISQTPVTLALLRFLLEGSYKDAEYSDSGASRLIKCFNYCQNSLQEEMRSNQQGWDEYYQSLMNTELNQATKLVLSQCLLTLE